MKLAYDDQGNIMSLPADSIDEQQASLVVNEKLVEEAGSTLYTHYTVVNNKLVVRDEPLQTKVIKGYTVSLY